MYNYLEPVDDGLTMRNSRIWAVEKLHYLQSYVFVLGKSMRNKWPALHYIDLLSGPGKNLIQETGEVILGSPLLALTTQYPFSGYYFTDLRRRNIDALKQRCSASALADRVQAAVGDCNVMVDWVVDQLARSQYHSLNLAFLDPEGLELQWTTVAKLALIRRMDLIINYPEGGLNRFMRQASVAEEETSVNRFFGGREWRTIYATHQRTRRGLLRRQLLDHYKSKLRSLGYGEVLQGDEPLMRNVARRAPLYRLLFASKHPLGDRFWHEVTRRDLYGQRRLLDAG